VSQMNHDAAIVRALQGIEKHNKELVRVMEALNTNFVAFGKIVKEAMEPLDESEDPNQTELPLKKPGTVTFENWRSVINPHVKVDIALPDGFFEEFRKLTADKFDEFVQSIETWTDTRCEVTGEDPYSVFRQAMNKLYSSTETFAAGVETRMLRLRDEDKSPGEPDGT